MHQFKQLTVWNNSVDFCVDCYQLTAGFPSEERFGLTSQIRRSAVSIPSNIAEGAGRNADGEFVHFLGIAGGSACELETQLIIAQRLNFIDTETLNKASVKLNEIQNKVYKLQSAVKNKSKK